MKQRIFWARLYKWQWFSDSLLYHTHNLLLRVHMSQAEPIFHLSGVYYHIWFSPQEYRLHSFHQNVWPITTPVRMYNLRQNHLVHDRLLGRNQTEKNVCHLSSAIYPERVMQIQISGKARRFMLPELFRIACQDYSFNDFFLSHSDMWLHSV